MLASEARATTKGAINLRAARNKAAEAAETVAKNAAAQTDAMDASDAAKNAAEGAEMELQAAKASAHALDKNQSLWIHGFVEERKR